jgi:hypothetical protein
MTYASEASPTQNFGGNDKWRIGRNPSGQRWFGYIQGQLPDVPSGCSLYTGYIYVAPGDALDANGDVVLPTGSGQEWKWANHGIPQINVSAAGSAWDKNSLAWNGRPAPTGSAETGYPDSGSWILPVPGDTLLAMLLGSTPNNGFVLRPSGGTDGAFWWLLNTNRAFVITWQ